MRCPPRRMRLCWVARGGIALAILTASATFLTASGAELEKRWGVGAGLFREGGEASLLRRVSGNTAVVMDVVGLHQEVVRSMDYPPPSPTQRIVQSLTRVEAGPRLRRFFGRDESWRPYLDAFAHGAYERVEFTSLDTGLEIGRGLRAGAAFGLEYDLPWRFSVAVHSGLLSYSWLSLRGQVTTESGIVIKSSGQSQNISVGLSPEGFVRIYF